MSDREYLPGGDKLRARREAVGLSQRAVARHLGVSQSHVSYMETASQPVSERVIRAYMAYLDELEYEYDGLAANVD